VELIAATAHAHGARLVIANVADISHLHDVIEVAELKVGIDYLG